MAPDLSKPDKEVCWVCKGVGRYVVPGLRVPYEDILCPTCSGTGTKGGE